MQSEDFVYLLTEDVAYGVALVELGYGWGSSGQDSHFSHLLPVFKGKA